MASLVLSLVVFVVLMGNPMGWPSDVRQLCGIANGGWIAISGMVMWGSR